MKEREEENPKGEGAHLSILGRSTLPVTSVLTALCLVYVLSLSLPCSASGARASPPQPPARANLPASRLETAWGPRAAPPARVMRSNIYLHAFQTIIY